ncbi:Hypothetical protein R9X50_00066900 [Acrodontium crateriforme]|uniref:Protein kinase domain-containing protein n=1 Tax=Acrodontium crateriforme TaxID=150365 RepID=A0AAQ3LYA0_9PEZI|nr:Hypothetical protein R9X50_00066900 [Acrodontium crateriforme]
MLRQFFAPPSQVFSRRFISRARMHSSVMGDSGRIYSNCTLLRRHPRDSTFDIFKTTSADKVFILKRVPKLSFDLSQQISEDIPSSRRLRMHVDCNSKELILVYPYFRDTLLALLTNDPAFPPDERLKIMRGVGKAIRELHEKDWVHCDVKPDNILIDWTCDSHGNKIVTDVTLGDFDIVRKVREGETSVTPYAIGNAMWRSPEGQTGILTRASDIYSLGLVYIYILGGGELLMLNDYQTLVKAGISPEQEVITKHFCYFGPVPEELYRQIKDEKWRTALQVASRMAEVKVEERPILRLNAWGQELGQTAIDMLSAMTNLDPEARPTIHQVLTFSYW